MSGIDETGRIRGAFDRLHHLTSIFPEDTDETITFTAAAGANTFSAWTEIADNNAVTLSSKFATADGHITACVVETISDDAAIYLFELSWGAANNIITRMRFAGVGKFQAAHMVDRFYGTIISAGETVYYRMKTETGVADTCTVHFRYHSH